MSRLKKKTKILNLDMQWMERAVLLIFLDVICILAAFFAALLLRFDFVFSNIPRQYMQGYIWSMPYWVMATIVTFYGCRLYHSIWKFASISELARILNAYIILIILWVIGMLFMKLQMPRSYYFVGLVFSMCLTTGSRFGYRLIRAYVHRSERNRGAEHIMVIGAGEAGLTIIRELKRSSHLNGIVSCVIDDDVNKTGRLIEGAPIVGTRDDILSKAEEYIINTIIFAIPSMPVDERRKILNLCSQTRCRLQTVPGVYQLVNGEVSISKLKDVDITDLLGRAQVKVNNEEIFSAIKGKTILVTGGGGSIGSELCRQIAHADPKLLIIFDIYENNAYDIQQELKRRYPNLNFLTLIGSVRNTSRINWIMKTYKPDAVYHAAAHKHVPLMEDSPNEAIKNNVLGTYKTARAAAENGVSKFTLISTDKAVNPTNIMGATKRLCEMIVQMMNRRYPNTDFVAVRFGNVLGSNGSVIPLFKQQITEGGPVTVTDKNIIRYFMTIPEAVSLVLQASYYARGGEIFILDMGDPVRIDDMARNLIRLSGYEPDVDIKVEYTGLRPGEKLYEELLMAEEGMQDTDNALIHIGKPIEMDDEWFEEKIHELDDESYEERDDMKWIVAEVVPTYHPDQAKMA